MSREPETSAEIVQGIYQGDRKAESLLIQKYGRSVLYILEKRCGDPELARDIRQETFLVLLEKFRRQMIAEPDKLGAYVQQTAINILIANNRKDARRKTQADSELIEACVDGDGGPIDDLEKLRIRHSVREGILGLNNSRDREILYRYYIYEHEKDEICRHLNIDFRHFDKVISRARSRLRQAMQSAGEESLQEVTG